MRPLCQRAVRGKRGFTLIELLVAITILGLLTSLGAGLLHLGGRSWEKANRMSADISAIESAQSLLRLELTRAQLAPDPNSSFVAFNGGTDFVAFRAALPRSLEGSGPAEIQIRTESSSDNRQNLIMAWRIQGMGNWTKSIILPGVKNVRFGYYGSLAETAAPQWQINWADRKTLPQAIRLDIDFPAGDSRFWPAFIVAPLITTDISCLHNPAAQC
jgi:general secretion pathway protein J